MGERIYEENELFSEVSENMNKNTHKSRGKMFKLNAGKNEEMVRGRGALPRDFTGYDVFLVGAGEGLEDGIPFLRHNQGRVKILCVDMALKAIMDRGVVPDFCFTLEPINSYWRFFDGLDTSKTTLISHAFANHSQQRAWKGPREYARFPPEGDYWLDKMYKRTVYAKLPLYISAGNVLSFAFVYAFACKSRTITFIGNDLGWQRSYYSRGTPPHAQDVRNCSRLNPVEGGSMRDMRAEKDRGKRLQVDKDGFKYFTNAAFFMSRKWLDDFIEFHKVKNVFCSSPMGIYNCVKVKLKKY